MRPSRSWAGIAIVAVAVALGGCSGPASTPEPSPTLPSGWTRYVDGEHGFSLGVPPGWYRSRAGEGDPGYGLDTTLYAAGGPGGEGELQVQLSSDPALSRADFAAAQEGLSAGASADAGWELVELPSGPALLHEKPPTQLVRYHYLTVYMPETQLYLRFISDSAATPAIWRSIIDTWNPYEAVPASEQPSSSG